MSSTTELTPLERLAASRKALIRHMSGDGRTPEDHGDFEGDEPFHAASSGAWETVKQAMRTFWRNHPVGVAIDLARPVIGKYAEEQPFKLLGISASIGAAAVLLRPWRLVSLGAVLVAALKSSELSNVLFSMLATARHDAEKPSTTL
ncbi:MAG: hypothetical protein JJD98_09175 [Polaromonas sp.]|nr:hypothetical protein [Polaromonas sp.]